MIAARPLAASVAAASTPGARRSCVTMNNHGTGRRTAHAHASRPSASSASADRCEPVSIARLKKLTGKPLKMYVIASFASTTEVGTSPHIKRQAESI
jgi:hypothetical protein